MLTPFFEITYKARKFQIRQVLPGWQAFEVKDDPTPLMFTLNALGSPNSPWRCFEDIINFIAREEGF